MADMQKAPMGGSLEPYFFGNARTRAGSVGSSRLGASSCAQNSSGISWPFQTDWRLVSVMFFSDMRSPKVKRDF